jgi:AcrR family transcriptional regulator
VPDTAANAPVSLDDSIDTPSRIEFEAIRLFSTRGYHDSTMREIMTACNLTPGAFYNHFRSKEELLYTLVIDAHDDLESYMIAAEKAAGPDPAARLHDVSHVFSIWHCNNAEWARVANLEYKELDGEMLTEVQNRRRTIRTRFELLIEDGWKQESFRLSARDANIRLLSTCVSEMLVDTAMWFRPDRAWTVEEIADAQAAIVLRMVNATPVP